MAKPTPTEIKNILRDLTDDDPEFMEELTTAYIENLEEFNIKASEAVRIKDLESYKACLHKINPTLLTLQCENEYEMLSAVKTRLNEASLRENLKLINLIVQQITLLLQSVKQSIKGRS